MLCLLFYITDSQNAPERFGWVLQSISMYPEIRFILHTGDMVENGLVEDEWKAMLHDNRKYTAYTLINSVSGNYHEDNGAELYNHFHKTSCRPKCGKRIFLLL